ncbi:hypothetical protein MMC18_005474 [Xylographa bjoerkii]|nr:hypothetical protein [Xylographa bjoerkii]
MDMTWPRHGPQTIEIHLPGKRFRIRRDVLETHLPGLHLQPHIHPRSLHRHWDSAKEKAHTYLFTHLSELSHHGTSAALLHSLETSFQSRPLHHHDPTCEIFNRLGYLLRRDFLNGHPALLSPLLTFFTRHCAAICRRNSHDGIMYLGTLACLPLALDDALACIAQQPTLVADLLAAAAELDVPVLPPHLRTQLLLLTQQSLTRRPASAHRHGERTRQCSCGALEMGGGGGSGRKALWAPRARLLRGDELAPAALLHVAQLQPDRVFVQPGGAARHRGYCASCDEGGASDDDGYGYSYSGGEGYVPRGGFGRRAIAAGPYGGWGEEAWEGESEL